MRAGGPGELDAGDADDVEEVGASAEARKVSRTVALSRVRLVTVTGVTRVGQALAAARGAAAPMRSTGTVQAAPVVTRRRLISVMGGGLPCVG